MNINNNKINLTNEGISYGLVITGINDYEEYTTIFAENLAITNNTIDMKSTYANALQLLYLENVEISGNEINIDADYGLGMVSTILRNLDMYKNNMTINSRLKTEGPSYDAYFKTAGGISIVYDMMGSSTNNNIYNNSVIVTCNNNEIPAINLTSGVRYTTITDNYLISDYGYGDDAVADKGTYTTISNNLPKHSTTVVLEVDPTQVNMFETETVNMTISLTDADGENITQGTVTVYIGNEKVAEFDVEKDDLVVEITGYEVGTYNITVNYLTFNEKLYENAELETNLNVKSESKVNTSTENLTLGETTNLQATFFDEEGVQVTDGKAIFRVNGKTLRDDDGKVIYVDVVNGVAQMPDVNITGEWMKPETTIQAVYLGNDDTEPIFTKETTINLTKPVANITITSDSSAAVGDKISLSATLTDGDKTINSGCVAFKLNGKTLKDENGKALYVDVVDGVASTTYTIPAKTKAKTYTLTAVYIDATYERAECEKELIITKS
jgi:hypothetical protein